MKQFVIDGNKVILSVSNPDTRVDDAEFEENEVYSIDIVTSTGEGKVIIFFKLTLSNYLQFFPEFYISSLYLRTLLSCLQPKLLDEKQTTIYKRAVDKNYHLKMKASRFIFSEISQKFPIMPFTARYPIFLYFKISFLFDIVFLFVYLFIYLSCIVDYKLDISITGHWKRSVPA